MADRRRCGRRWATLARRSTRPPRDGQTLDRCLRRLVPVRARPRNRARRAIRWSWDAPVEIALEGDVILGSAVRLGQPRVHGQPPAVADREGAEPRIVRELHGGMGSKREHVGDQLVVAASVGVEGGVLRTINAGRCRAVRRPSGRRSVIRRRHRGTRRPVRRARRARCRAETDCRRRRPSTSGLWRRSNCLLLCSNLNIAAAGQRRPEAPLVVHVELRERLQVRTSATHQPFDCTRQLVTRRPPLRIGRAPGAASNTSGAASVPPSSGPRVIGSESSSTPSAS